ncbi:hypothetical protein [Absidia glauca]|uniref:Uncharacterized protein n=1 Tax=Absidia glauca TaxID=4829 RepID=A0A168SSX4_ABSGL|nr:hypothetical protein [Absidia glauca]
MQHTSDLNPEEPSSIHDPSIHPSSHPSLPEVLSSLNNETIPPQLIKYPHRTQSSRMSPRILLVTPHEVAAGNS